MNPQRPIRLIAVARGSHAEVIARSRDAVSSSGGSILDYHLFSNAILCLTIDVAVRNLRALATALDAAEIRLDSASLDQVDELSSLSGADAANRPRVEGTLSVNIINDDPPLRIEVPAVPG